MTIEFLRDLTHELNTSLTILGYNVEKLEKKYLSNSFVKNIVYEQDVIARSLKNHVLLLELEAKKVSLSKLSLSKCVYQILSKYHNILKNWFNYWIEESLYIRWKKEWIEFVLKELIENSIKHSDKKVRVNIFLQKVWNMAVFEIKNNFSGFYKSEEKLIFHKYYRGKIAKRKLIRWTWIGLTIIKEILWKVNAEIIAVSSRNESKFIIKFPLS